MKLRKILFSCTQILLCISLAQAQNIAEPDGYASYAGTTGGGNATPIVVTTAEAFRSAVCNNTPAVIIVEGRIEVGTVSIGSNKTIIGADSTAGLYGGTIRLDKSNYIIQNLTIGPYTGDDAMEVTGATKVFIHKCEFYDGADGNLDIVRASDYITVSWCKFYYVNQTTHTNTVLIGNGDNVTTDEGKLHVTMHHNWFAEGCNSSMPRVRYGHIHIYNNYYSSTDNNYCIGVGYKSHIRVENSYFDGVNDPWEIGAGLSSAYELGWDNLRFVNCSQPTEISNSYPVFTLPYSFTLDPADSVKSFVRAGAGNVIGDSYNNSLKVSFKSPPDSAKFASNSSIVIEAEASVMDDTIAYVQFLSDSLFYTDSIAPFLYTWDNVNTGMCPLMAIASDFSGRKAYSKGITVFAGSGVSITQPPDDAKFTLPPDITINATAWDEDGTVSGVEFFQESTSLGTDYTPPYSAKWNDVPPGTYKLSAIAIDNDNDTTVSEDVTIFVTGGPEGYEYCSSEGDVCRFDGIYNIAFGADGHFNYEYNVSGNVDCSSSVFGDPVYGVERGCYVQALVIPIVSITYPISGSYFSAPASITITANTIDNDGTIDSVCFYQDEDLIGVSYIEPYSFSWDNVTAGAYSITAEATDNDGNSGVSEAVNITVVNRTGIVNHDVAVMEVYPNPVSGELTLRLNDNYQGCRNIILYNSIGEIIMKDTFSGGEHIMGIKAVPEGFYILTLTSIEGNIIRKIIKK